MKQREPVIVYDLAQDESFPTYGESRSELVVSGCDARLTVLYENAEGAGVSRITFKFAGASQVVRSSCPGVGDPALGGGPASLGRLVQIENSAIAQRWTDYWSQRPKMPPTLHFQIVLTEANEKFDIFAWSVEVKREWHDGK